jgi:hypothetical protein
MPSLEGQICENQRQRRLCDSITVYSIHSSKLRSSVYIRNELSSLKFGVSVDNIQTILIHINQDTFVQTTL